MALRFANAVFAPLWQRSYIDPVQIAVSETLGAEDRGGSYVAVATLREMVQGHQKLPCQSNHA